MSKENQIVYMVLNCNAKKIAPKVILPATEYVVNQIKKHLELKTHGKTARGTYQGVEVSVVSSNMGAPSAAMVMEALNRSKVQYIIRVDYCGGLTDDIKVGDIILCSDAICGDGTTPHYLNPPKPYPKVAADTNLTSLIRKELDSRGHKYHFGPIWSHDALFREPLELLDRARDYGAIALDMETSVVFALGEIFNIPTAAVLVVTDKPSGKGIANEEISISAKVFQNLDKVIDMVLSVLPSLRED